VAEVDKNLLEKLSEDRSLASAVLFSHRHPQASPDFHVEIVDLWRARDEFVLIEAFREGGKSTLSEEFLTLEGCYGNFFYALLIGETYSKACQRLESIAKEAAYNTKLHSLFGGKVLARKPVENKVWFKTGALIEAVGWEQELQSFKYLDHRPDVAYLDDPENLERVRDSAAVDASEKKFWLELVPAMDKNRRRIRLTQTRRSEDCMVTRFAGNPEFVYRAFPICNGDIDAPETAALWPSRYPMEWIRRERDIYRAGGRLSDFLQSRMLQATNQESKPFRDEHIRSMDVAPWQWMPKYAIYDPARTTNPEKSDQAGKVVVSRFGSKILVHESGGYYWKPDALVKDLFAVNEQHRPALIGVEKNSLDDWLMQPIRIEMMRRGVALPLRALQAPQDRNKENFILGLQPFFEAGDIALVGGKVAHAQLTAEILNFPQGTLNILNALAYSLRMFSGQPIYEDFGHANIGDAPEPKYGEIVHVGFNATPNETVCVAVVRERRSVFVAADFSASGAPGEAVKLVASDLRANFPRARFQVWVPAEIYDQHQRIALVPALRAAGLTPFRGEHVAIARGCLSDKIKTVVRNRRMLMVDQKARLTANALSAGYCLQVERGGRTTAEPEQGISRLVGEALENLTFELDRELNDGALKGAHLAVNAQGQQYHTALPSARR
jgi:hypothetical protein